MRSAVTGTGRSRLDLVVMVCLGNEGQESEAFAPDAPHFFPSGAGQGLLKLIRNLGSRLPSACPWL